MGRLTWEGLHRLRHPGFYLRVLEEGELGAGDPIALVEAGADGATVERAVRGAR
jgi:MOSC domain-containing protein YiiM